LERGPTVDNAQSAQHQTPQLVFPTQLFS